MFATFDYTSLPIIHIYMNNEIENDEDFDRFTNEWILIYSRRQPVNFVFHAEKVGLLPIKYAFKMSSFMKKLKKYSEQYLKKSVIVIDDYSARRLLNLIFFLQPPVADVYVTCKPDLIDTIMENDFKEDGLEWEYIPPGKSMIPFL